jgi:hypothetical protein
VYKAFLDVLHTYQKQERTISEVHQQVAGLFKSHPDLIQKFTQFLPRSMKRSMKRDVFSNEFDEDVGKLFLPIGDKPLFEVFNGIPIKQIRENSITELDLKGSKGKELEAFGGIILAHVLTGSTSLQYLDVSSNRLGPDGGKAIAASIAENSTITSVRTLFREIFFGLSLFIPFPLSLLSLFTLLVSS